MIPELLMAAALLWCWPQQTPAQEPEARFGTTVYAESGFEGTVYYLKPGTEQLPNFKRRKPVGHVYASSLNVAPQGFDHGFPGLTDRFEWFAIDYAGRFWFEKPGRYEFSLISDDGSKFYIDGKKVIDNDGMHPAQEVSRFTRLTAGVHTLRVSYFQGPRYDVALVLQVAGPGEPLHLFRSQDFQVPPAIR